MTSKAPVLFLELVDQRPSGFVLDGTNNTPFYQELHAPNISWIPADGFMSEMKKEKVNGKEVEIRHNKRIRYIKNENDIDFASQEKRGIKPAPHEDKIPFEKGYATIVGEGSTIGLYNYLSVVFYNAGAPNRPDTATPIFRVLDLNKKAEEFNESDIEMADAIKLAGELYTSTGKKDNPYIYDEDRIDAIARILNVIGETPTIKLRAIIVTAKNRPRWFLDNVVKFEQIIFTEVSHALQLDVIEFDGNTAQYKGGAKIIKSLGTEKLSQTDKVEKLASYLKTNDGTRALTELRAAIEFAKEKQLK